MNAGRLRWLPPVIWVGVIFWLSTDDFSADHTWGVIEPALRWVNPDFTPAQLYLAHYYARKAAHFAVYAVLAWLVLDASRPRAGAGGGLRWAVSALAIVAGCALLDEYHQFFTDRRAASPYDSLIDVAGGFAAVAALGAARWQKGARAE